MEYLQATHDDSLLCKDQCQVVVEGIGFFRTHEKNSFHGTARESWCISYSCIKDIHLTPRAVASGLNLLFIRRKIELFIKPYKYAQQLKCWFFKAWRRTYCLQIVPILHMTQINVHIFQR